MKQELLDKVGCYEFLAEPFHCDFASRLFMGHLGNHLLNAADFHSNDRGYGMIMELFPTYIDILKKYVIEVRYAKGEFPRLEYNTHISVILSLTNQEFLEKLFDFAYLDHDISKMDSEIAQGIHLLSIGNAYTEVEDTKNLILSIKEKKDYMDLEKAIAMESQRRLINALPERIDGTEYDRKGVIKEIQKLELV